MVTRTEQIVLATSGSLQCRKAEEYAVSLSNKLKKPLHVIHVTNIKMARYGIIEPLAPDICSKQFSKYITDQADETLNNVLVRIKKLETMADLAIHFHSLQGDPVKKIQQFISQQKVETILVIGKEKQGQCFFRIKPDLSKKLMQKCMGRHVQVFKI